MSYRSSAAPVLVLLATAAALAAPAACTPPSRHEDTFASETRTTAAEIPVWTKIVAPLPPATDVVRPTREERAADAFELPTPQAAAAPSPTLARPQAAAAARPLPDWVPASGCLTIVGASDLARNLGMLDELDEPAATR
jgi:hypothetical protein